MQTGLTRGFITADHIKGQVLEGVTLELLEVDLLK